MALLMLPSMGMTHKTPQMPQPRWIFDRDMMGMQILRRVDVPVTSEAPSATGGK